jgi:hypothetical protein
LATISLVNGVWSDAADACVIEATASYSAACRSVKLAWMHGRGVSPRRARMIILRFLSLELGRAPSVNSRPDHAGKAIYYYT